MTSKLYAEMQDRFLTETRIEVGSFVKLTAVSNDGAMGWGGRWDDYDYSMDYISECASNDEGNQFKVITIHDTQGLLIEDVENGAELNVPFFCVERIEKVSTIRVEMSCGTIIIISEHGFNVDDSSYEFDAEDLEKFIEAYENFKMQ